MKATNAGIDAVLAFNARMAADLYTFYFAEGTQRWTGANTDLTYGADTWLATGPIITRDGSRCTAGLEVDETSIELATGQRTLGTQTLKLAATTGSFDGIRVLIQRAWMSTWGTIPGLITLFDGVVSQVEPGSVTINVSVRSRLERLNAPVPERLIEAACTHRLTDAGCGLSEATLSVTTLTVAAGSTTTLVKTSGALSYPAGLVPGSKMTITSGALNGTIRMVTANSGVDLTISPPLPAVPATGVTLKFLPRCAKDRAACSAFGNLLRYGGFPDLVPQVFQIGGGNSGGGRPGNPDRTYRLK